MASLPVIERSNRTEYGFTLSRDLSHSDRASGSQGSLDDKSSENRRSLVKFFFKKHPVAIPAVISSLATSPSNPLSFLLIIPLNLLTLLCGDIFCNKQ